MYYDKDMPPFEGEKTIFLTTTIEECIKVAEKARYYMDDYHISEYDAVPEAIKYYKYDERL